MLLEADCSRGEQEELEGEGGRLRAPGQEKGIAEQEERRGEGRCLGKDQGTATAPRDPEALEGEAIMARADKKQEEEGDRRSTAERGSQSRPEVRPPPGEDEGGPEGMKERRERECLERDRVELGGHAPVGGGLDPGAEDECREGEQPERHRTSKGDWGGEGGHGEDADYVMG